MGNLTAEAPRKQEFSGEAHLRFWRKRLHKPRFVYVLQAKPGTPIKIGRARDVRARMKGLQTGNPQILHLLFVLPGDHELEWQYHQRLSDCRLQGEWFEPRNPEQLFSELDELAEYLVAAYDGSGVAPDFRNFDSAWFVRQKSHKPVSVRFIEPTPLSAEEVARNISRRPWKRRVEQDRQRWHAEMAEPAFAPHRPR